MEYQNIYRIELSKKLSELGIIVHEESGSTFRLKLNKDDLSSVMIELVTSEPIIERLHGTKNNTPITAIGYFKFKLSLEGNEPNFYIFALNNAVENKVEFVVVPTDELINRIASRKRITDKVQETELKFWLLPNKMVFDTTSLGAEGEWWFIGGRMARNTHLDYTQYQNVWDRLMICGANNLK